MKSLLFDRKRVNCYGTEHVDYLGKFESPEAAEKKFKEVIKGMLED